MTNKKLCLLDYGSGNVGSVSNLLRYLNIDFEIVKSNNESIYSFSHYLLPGVGAFKAAMDSIENRFDMKELRNHIYSENKKFLGICVGMQVLASVGYEFGEANGLNWIPGSVRLLKSEKLPLPHVGWNDVNNVKVCNLRVDGKDFYFVHSYCFDVDDSNFVIGKTEYGENFNSIIGDGNIFGVQFHPEKSSINGQQMLLDFYNL